MMTECTPMTQETSGSGRWDRFGTGLGWFMLLLSRKGVGAILVEVGEVPSSPHSISMGRC